MPASCFGNRRSRQCLAAHTHYDSVCQYLPRESWRSYFWFQDSKLARQTQYGWWVVKCFIFCQANDSCPLPPTLIWFDQIHYPCIFGNFWGYWCLIHFNSNFLQIKNRSSLSPNLMKISTSFGSPVSLEAIPSLSKALAPSRVLIVTFWNVSAHLFFCFCCPPRPLLFIRKV